MNLRDLPLMLAAAVLLAAGAWRVATGDTEQYTGAALLAAGMIVLGVWIDRDDK